VGFAKKQDDSSLPRPWSRHSQGSSAFEMTHKKKREEKSTMKLSKADREAKKDKFKAFLTLMDKNDNKG